MEFWMMSNEYRNASKYLEAGITHICVDIERIGKAKRQEQRNTFISDHQIYDVKRISNEIGRKHTICRINPIGNTTSVEINSATNFGAGSIILPYFKKLDEISIFLNQVNSNVRSIALVETPQALFRIPEIIKLKNLDHIHIGLNDLSLELDFEDMFEIVKLGWLEQISSVINLSKNIKFGFGGVGSINDKSFSYPAENILKHHKICKSESVIISRSFFEFCRKKSKNYDRDYFRIVKDEIHFIKEFLENE